MPLSPPESNPQSALLPAIKSVSSVKRYRQIFPVIRQQIKALSGAAAVELYSPATDGQFQPLEPTGASSVGIDLHRLLERTGMQGKPVKTANTPIRYAWPIFCDSNLEAVAVIGPLNAPLSGSVSGKISLFMEQLPPIIEQAKELHQMREMMETHTRKLEKHYAATRHDLSLAQKIQSKLLAHRLPTGNGVAFSVIFQPMIEVGGDLYDILEIRHGYYRIMIADATGHGVQAAMITMLIKSEYDLLKRISISPADLMTSLNTRFSSSYGDLGSYFTAIIVDIDIDNRRITYCSAGHPDQFLYFQEKIVTLQHNGRLIGVSPDFPYRDISLPLIGRANLLLFSDGIGEGFNREGTEYGEFRLQQFLTAQPLLSAESLVENLHRDQMQFTSGLDQADDITIVGIEIREI